MLIQPQEWFVYTLLTLIIACSYLYISVQFKLAQSSRGKVLDNHNSRLLVAVFVVGALNNLALPVFGIILVMVKQIVQDVGIFPNSRPFWIDVCVATLLSIQGLQAFICAYTAKYLRVKL